MCALINVYWSTDRLSIYAEIYINKNRDFCITNIALEDEKISSLLLEEILKLWLFKVNFDEN